MGNGGGERGQRKKGEGKRKGEGEGTHAFELFVVSDEVSFCVLCDCAGPVPFAVDVEAVFEVVDVDEGALFGVEGGIVRFMNLSPKVPLLSDCFDILT